MTSKCDSFQDRDPASGPSYDFAGSAPDGHVTSTQSEALGEGNDPASGADSPASKPPVIDGPMPAHTIPIQSEEWKGVNPASEHHFTMSTMTIQRYEGICDVCGADISLEHDFPRSGILDHDYTDEGRLFTWKRHYATTPPGANPGCAKYFSRVYEVPWPREEQNQESKP